MIADLVTGTDIIEQSLVHQDTQTQHEITRKSAKVHKLRVGCQQPTTVGTDVRKSKPHDETRITYKARQTQRRLEKRGRDYIGVIPLGSDDIGPKPGRSNDRAYPG